MAPLSKSQEATARLRARQIQRFVADSNSRKASGGEPLPYASNLTENDIRLASIIEPTFEGEDDGGRYPQDWAKKSTSLSTTLHAFRNNAQQLVDNNVKGTPNIKPRDGEPKQEAQPVSGPEQSSPSRRVEVAALTTATEHPRVAHSNPQPDTTQEKKAFMPMPAIQPASFPAVAPSTSAQSLSSSPPSGFGSYHDPAPMPDRLVGPSLTNVLVATIEEQNDKLANMQKMLESLMLKSQQDDKRMAEMEMREKKRLKEEKHQRQVAAESTRKDKAKEQEVVVDDGLPTPDNDPILTGGNMKQFWELHRRVREEREAREARRRYFE